MNAAGSVATVVASLGIPGYCWRRGVRGARLLPRGEPVEHAVDPQRVAAPRRGPAPRVAGALEVEVACQAAHPTADILSTSTGPTNGPCLTTTVAEAQSADSVPASQKGGAGADRAAWARPVTSPRPAPTLASSNMVEKPTSGSRGFSSACSCLLTSCSLLVK